MKVLWRLKPDPIKYGSSLWYLLKHLIIPKELKIAFNEIKFIKTKRQKSITDVSLGVCNDSTRKYRIR